jgi:hypothetical protein
MEKEKWSIAIWLSSQGFEGVQFFEASPDVRGKILAVLPKCSPLIEGVEGLIRQMDEEGQAA